MSKSKLESLATLAHRVLAEYAETHNRKPHTRLDTLSLVTGAIRARDAQLRAELMLEAEMAEKLGLDRNYALLFQSVALRLGADEPRWTLEAEGLFRSWPPVPGAKANRIVACHTDESGAVQHVKSCPANEACDCKMARREPGWSTSA